MGAEKKEKKTVSELAEGGHQSTKAALPYSDFSAPIFLP